MHLTHNPRVALVTGAGRGIGKAIAERLAAHGHTVLCVSKSDTCVQVANDILAKGQKAKAFQVDVSDAAAVDKAFDDVNFHLQRMDRQGVTTSVLSLVGLLPALLVGLDAGAVRRGADAVLGAVLGDDGAGSAPAQGAALAAAAMADGRLGQSVLLSYADRLQPFGLWYRQLWAESLGKQGHGTTPVDALGPVDQHSQLQLYLDGPADKLFTVLTVTAAGRGPVVDAGLAGDLGLGYLAGRTIGDLTDAMARGTTDALVAAGRPVRRIAVDRLDEESLGALLMHFMLETVLAAFLIGVDPFDQPAVEDGKRRARAYLDAGAA